MSELLVIGSSAAVPNPANPCSCLVLLTVDVQIMLDCGHGAVSAARTMTDLGDLDVVYLSHAHPDHIGDIFALRGYLHLSGADSRPALLTTAAVGDVLDTTVDALQLGSEYLRDEFDFVTLRSPGTLNLGKTKFETWPAKHNAASTLLRMTTSDGMRVVYTSDTGWTGDLASIARNADLLIVENAAPLGDQSDRGRWHLDANQITKLIRAATPRRTLITHYFDEFIDETLHIIRSRTSLPVEKAKPGTAYVL